MNAAVTDVRPIELKHMVLSATEAQEERRARFDKGALAELAKSLTTTGQINPITVRPLPKGAFEIVAGERRYLAAKIAGLKQVVCSVRELTDEQVLEVQIIENLQREDLHELAEAEAYEKLVKMGRTPAEIAGQVHKDESYVRKRMRLLALGKKGRKAFYAGEITVAIALILSRIPVPSLQDQALESYLDDRDYNPLTATEFRNWVQREYMTDLASAPFDTTDPTLVPDAGPCAKCPKNTLGQGQLFDEIARKAHCTDSVCFGAKRDAHGKRLLEKAQQAGKEVITGKAAATIAKHGVGNLQGGYVAVAGHWYGQPVKKAMPKGLEPKLLLVPDSGQVIEVVREKDLVKPKAGRRDDGGMDRYRAEQRAREQAKELDTEHRRRVFQGVHQAKLEAADHSYWLREACIEFFGELSADTKVLLAKAMGWEVKGKSTGMSYARHFDIDPFLPKDVPGLWKLLRALTLAGDLMVSSWGTSQPKKLLAAAAAVKVDAKKIRAELVAERQAKKKAKTKKAPARKK